MQIAIANSRMDKHWKNVDMPWEEFTERCRNTTRTAESLSEYKKIHLTIRDDGSKDDTISIIKMQQKKYPDRIALVEGENVGYRKSFLRLLDFAIDADYYGFADQDDLWKEEKISRAVECLENAEKPICLYVGSLEIVDSNLQEIDAKYPKLPGRLPKLYAWMKI